MMRNLHDAKFNADGVSFIGGLCNSSLQALSLQSNMCTYVNTHIAHIKHVRIREHTHNTHTHTCTQDLAQDNDPACNQQGLTHVHKRTKQVSEHTQMHTYRSPNTQPHTYTTAHVRTHIHTQNWLGIQHTYSNDLHCICTYKHVHTRTHTYTHRQWWPKMSLGQWRPTQTHTLTLRYQN